jgi:hypothetical protein
MARAPVRGPSGGLAGPPDSFESKTTTDEFGVSLPELVG